MRNNIYYWKCDSPLSAEDKRQLFFKEKYARKDLPRQIVRIVGDWLNETPASVMPVNSDGNHFAYVITLSSGRKYFFRGDEGLLDDDYMIAETRVSKDLRDAGIPVPRVRHSGNGTDACPMKFQILDFHENACLNEYYKAGTLDVQAIATQLGKYLRSLHRMEYPGFGFFNTDTIRKSGALAGLDACYTDYFYKRLDDHLSYLSGHNLLAPSDTRDVLSIFKRHEPELFLQQGVLVHRDMALWNVLGTRDTVTAIIDWDDCVVGDPSDDIGIIACFHDDDFMAPLLHSYSGGAGVSPDFILRVNLHKLRNILWKTVIRDYMGYFNKDSSFFLNSRDSRQSLREYTLDRLFATLILLKNKGTG